MANEQRNEENSDIFRSKAETMRRRREEQRRLHMEQHRLHKEYHRRINDLYNHGNEFERYQRHARYSRPIILLFNLIVWFSIFHFFGIKVLGIIIASLISIGGILEFFFLTNLEKGIFKPIKLLKDGVEELGKGNYDVKVKYDRSNEMGILIDSFNEMVRKLKEGEELKLQYEENRKSLIANISHDLKTPITSIQGYIETMADRTDIPQETINKYHQIIYSNATYMNKLIDDLFLFSKLDMQKLELKFEHTNIRAFMEDLMEEFKFELEDRQIKFEYKDAMETSPTVKIDGKRIQQIFSNIIGNAVKYGAEDNIMINVKLFEKDEFIYIDIKDNGPGIPEEKLPYIFDRFYRIDYARTKNLMSTGLGLAIAKELVEAHGGIITASSKENEGTCFTITLPKDK